jgi:hypothetical protein
MVPSRLGEEEAATLINNPSIAAKVSLAFEAYEIALMANDMDAIEALSSRLREFASVGHAHRPAGGPLTMIAR